MGEKYSNQQVFDYYAEGKKDFYNKFSEESVLVQGKHRVPDPMITVILTTCKRPDLLKQALESALNQVDFDDYQIIIVDNEGADINIETETSKLVSGYQNEKVVYYRHEKPIGYKMDYAARLARSKWICFLHDDDILASNHLFVMSSIVQKHKRIKFLSCTYKRFYDEISDADFHTMIEPHKVTYQIKKYPKQYACLGYYVHWQGGLIDRKAYISTGGMPTISPGNGDYYMVEKFHYRYGVYELTSDTPLYFHRHWSGQLSRGGTELWKRICVGEYKYHTYVTSKYHLFFRDFWNRISAYRILRKCESYNKGIFQTSIDLEEVACESNMPQGVLDKGELYARDMIMQTLYKEILEKVFPPVKYKGQI